MRTLFIVLIAATTLLGACKKSNCPSAEKALIVDGSGVGGCGMLIELLDGTRLEPKNLNDFDIDQQNGKKVWVSYETLTTGGSVCMVGPVVQINCIVER